MKLILAFAIEVMELCNAAVRGYILSTKIGMKKRPGYSLT